MSKVLRCHGCGEILARQTEESPNCHRIILYVFDLTLAHFNGTPVDSEQVYIGCDCGHRIELISADFVE